MVRLRCFGVEAFGVWGVLGVAGLGLGFFGQV